MSTIKKLVPFFLLTIVTIIFFHKYLSFGQIPFPGDLLVAEYQPFRSYSYEGYVPGSVPNKAQYFDTIREFYPWRTFTTEELKKGKLPLWNPYNFSGAPHLANFQTAVFYPPNLLYLIVNQIDAWALLVLLQPLLASFFTFLYTRKIGINVYGAVLASIAFSYSQYMNVWFEFQVVGHTILWLPLILYSLELLVARYSPRNFLLLTLSLLFSLFAGHPLDFGTIFLFSCIYVLFKTWGKWPSSFRYFLPLIVALLLGSVQLIPTFKLLQNSTRAPFSYEFLTNNILIQPSQLITLLVPDFFGHPATRNYWPTNSYVGNTLSVGVITLFFAIFAIFNRKKYIKNKLFFFFLYGAFSTFFLATKNPLSLVLYKIQIPVLSSIQPTKLLSLFTFSVSILGGFGINVYMTYKDRLSRQHLSYISLILITVLALVLGVVFVPPEYRIVALKGSFLAICMSGSMLVILITTLQLNKFRKLTLIILTILLIGELYYSFQKFNPFVARSFVFPPAPILEYLKNTAGINRIWGYGTAKIDSNIATQYGLYSPDGFDALNLKWYNEFTRLSLEGEFVDKFTHETRSVAEIAPGYGELDLPDNEFRLRILDTLGVKYILDRVENPKNNETFPTSRFKLVWEDQAGWKVYENLLSAPRFFLTNKVIPYSTPEEFKQQFFAGDFDPRIMILIENNNSAYPLCSDTEQKNASIILQNYEPISITFEINTNCPTYLFLSDVFDENWKVIIDNNLSTIHRANYSFRGVYIPADTKKVEFSYSLF